MTTTSAGQNVCVREGDACSYSETGKHNLCDGPDTCGECEANPAEEMALFEATGRCNHDHCADYAYFGALYGGARRTVETRDERAERLADTELMADEFHGRAD